MHHSEEGDTPTLLQSLRFMGKKQFYIFCKWHFSTSTSKRYVELVGFFFSNLDKRAKEITVKVLICFILAPFVSACVPDS